MWRAVCTCGWTVTEFDPFTAAAARDAHVWPGGHAVTSLELVVEDEDGGGEAA